MSANGAFKSLPTFDKICERLAEAEKCIAAQGEIILEQQAELQERQLEIAFLMTLIHVTVPTSTIADGVTGKVPVERQSAAQVYFREGRAAMLKKFQHAQNLATARDASQESPASPPNGKEEGSGPAEFSITGKVTH